MIYKIARIFFAQDTYKTKVLIEKLLLIDNRNLK